MPTQEQKQEAVGKAASAFAELEQALDADEELVKRLRKAITGCYELGVGRQGEYLKITKRLKKIEGELAGLVADVIEIHEKCTAIAKREECDVPPNYAIDGGVVTPMGGTR